MFIRSFVLVLVLAFSFAIVNGQAPDGPKAATATPKARDLPFPTGVDLKFVITELARDLDLNVLFDPDSFRSAGRKAYIDFKNVTSSQALDYILLQEALYFEQVGPKTILIGDRLRGMSIPQIGVGVVPLSEQLAQYFGVNGGILISHVRDNSPASKAGLKAGDVIVEVQGSVTKGALNVVQTIINENIRDVSLTVVRDGKRLSMSVTLEKLIDSVLKKPNI